MPSKTLKKIIKILNGYIFQNYREIDAIVIQEELNKIVSYDCSKIQYEQNEYSYEELQELLSCINEKETNRKKNGVYYTPQDVVQFILVNSIKFSFNKLKPNNLHVMDLSSISYKTFCYEKTIYDPTCGAGAFLLAALEKKLDILDLHNEMVSKRKIQKVIETINGNDLNVDSISITKIRLFICLLHRYGVKKIVGITDSINNNFTSFDFIDNNQKHKKIFDVIIGNPPYVEDSKSKLDLPIKYGNIYANILINAAECLKSNGVLGFIIPLSYIATPRMEKARGELFKKIPQQFILNYSDRPDCLFSSVHQKLCILIGKKGNLDKTIFTSNYKYWFRDERQELFRNTDIIRNRYGTNKYIPKLGNDLELNIYNSIISKETSILEILKGKKTSIYLNMRATFWIKSFLNKHCGSEYKEFKCENKAYANFCMCILNSSLFWWYWVCVSDCWHITQKELLGFKVPIIKDFSKTNYLAVALEAKLEETKIYVGTRQTDYEYKHKECIDIIHKIDDYVNDLYGLSDQESFYIKNYALRYRIGGKK